MSYMLHSREKLIRLESSGDTLYLSTGFDRQWKPNSGNRKIIITVPEGTVLGKLELSTAAGDIYFSDINFDEGDFESASGSIKLTP